MASHVARNTKRAAAAAIVLACAIPVSNPANSEDLAPSVHANEAEHEEAENITTDDAVSALSDAGSPSDTATFPAEEPIIPGEETSDELSNSAMSDDWHMVDGTNPQNADEEPPSSAEEAVEQGRNAINDEAQLDGTNPRIAEGEPLSSAELPASSPVASTFGSLRESGLTVGGQLPPSRPPPTRSMMEAMGLDNAERRELSALRRENSALRRLLSEILRELRARPRPIPGPRQPPAAAAAAGPALEPNATLFVAGFSIILFTGAVMSLKIVTKFTRWP